MSRSIIFVTYPSAEALDLVGPAAVFANANSLAGEQLYRITVAAGPGGTIDHCGGIALATVPLDGLCTDEDTTLLVVGAQRASALSAAMADIELQQFLQESTATVERYGSICSGAFVLAAAGLLNGKRVTTHWAARDRLASLAPSCTIDGDAIYVSDGKLWTSAGVTTGIDMSLAMLAADHGQRLKAMVAKRLVVYAHRPGNQSQFSRLLNLQEKAGEAFGPLIDWLQSRLSAPTSVEKMAERCGMSPRNFHRRFVEAFGQTPGQLFETMRLEAIRLQLEDGQSVAVAANEAGYRSEAAFRSAFKACYGVTPSLYRQTLRRPGAWNRA